MQSFTDLVNMAKWLMDENQQPSVTQELGRLFPSIRGRGRRGESSQFLRVVADKSSALATDRNNIRGSKATSKKPQKSMSHKTISGKTHSNFAIFSCVKPTNFRFVTWFMPFRKFDLPQLWLEVFQTKSDLF